MRHYRKTLGGASIRFQPEDLPLHHNDPWDIRISLGDAPLEEAFYLTIPDPSATQLSIQTLLDGHVFSPSASLPLNTREHPDLPFLHEELRHYYHQFQQGALHLDFYINHHPLPHPISLTSIIQPNLSVCTFDNHSWDYRVLDLVLDPTPTPLPTPMLKQWWKGYGPDCFLILHEYFSQVEPSIQSHYQNHEIWKQPLSDQSPRLHQTLRYLSSKNLIRFNPPLAPSLTEEGQKVLRQLGETLKSWRVEFDRYFSVNLDPPALDIPGGFDVRLQMMDLKGVPSEKAAVLLTFTQNLSNLFQHAFWLDDWEQSSFFHLAHETLMYKTQFSRETLLPILSLS